MIRTLHDLFVMLWRAWIKAFRFEEHIPGEWYSEDTGGDPSQPAKFVCGRGHFQDPAHHPNILKQAADCRDLDVISAADREAKS